jgi:serine/threonine protein phosphatase PrpC
MNIIKRLFSQPKAQTTALPEQTDNRSPVPIEDKVAVLPPGFHIGQLSDIGQVRAQNEDSLLTFDAGLQYDYGQETWSLFIVADGMGGHQQGEIASSLAVRTAAAHIIENSYLPYLEPGRQSAANNLPVIELLQSAVEKANNAVLQNVPDGATTLTAALLMGNNAYIAHVGDTRAYLFKDNTLKQITKDHSLAQRLEELGQSGPGLANVKNVLYRAIGQDSAIEVDTYVQHLSPGTTLLLCSDGLWGAITEESLLQTLNDVANPQAICTRLVEQANQQGGHDNITVIAITLGGDDTPQSKSKPIL